MHINLIKDGKEVRYTVPFVSGRIFRTAICLQKKVQGSELNVDLLDDLVDFVVGVFGNQFSADEFYDGIKSSEMFLEIQRVIFACINGETEEKQNDKKK